MRASKYTILLVEDNPGDAELLKTCLDESNSAEFDVVVVTRLDQACAILQDQTYDAVLLDLGLPDSTGVDTVDIACSMTRQKRIPIVAISGSVEQESAIEIVLHGAHDALAKSSQQGVGLVQSIRLAIARQTSLNEAEDDEHRKQTESEFEALANMTAAPASTTVPAADGDRLSDTAPEKFALLVSLYSKLIDRTYEEEVLGVDGDAVDTLHTLSRNFAELRAEPRDVIECHLAAVKSKLSRVDQHRARFVNEAARTLMIEIIGDLAMSYKRDVPGSYG